MCATNIENGDWVCFNQTNIDYDELPQAALSSSSIPGTFAPQHFHGMVLTDGGMGPWGMDIDNAVMQCIDEMGYDMSNYTKEVL